MVACALHYHYMDRTRLEALREAERHELGHAQAAPALKEHAKVDVHERAAARVQQKVPQVAVPKAQQPAHLEPWQQLA